MNALSQGKQSTLFRTYSSLQKSSSCSVVFFLILSVGCAGKPAVQQQQQQPSVQQQQPSVDQHLDQTSIPLTPDMIQQLKSAEIILIGETHDHPKHHQIQAALIRRIKPKTVAFEMFDQHQTKVLSQLDQLDPKTWDQALTWTHRGWPDFELYRPIFDAALDVKARLIPAHPTRDVLHPLMMGQNLSDQLIADLKLDTPLPPKDREALVDIITRAHCGHANEMIVQAMMKAQRLKDAWMSRALIEAEYPVILIVGRGHTDPRWGIPWTLPQLSTGSLPSLQVVNLTPEQLEEDSTDKQIDIHVPAHRKDDPCERFREQLKSISKPHK